MIFSNIKTWKFDLDLYSESIKKALHYLEANDFSQMEVGEYEIDGRNIYIIVMDKQTQSVCERAPETHVKYIDIQYLVSGRESIGFSRINDDLKVSSDALAQKDLMLYENTLPVESFINMTPGDFGIFFPADVHRPLCAYGEAQHIRKVVVKIAV